MIIESIILALSISSVVVTETTGKGLADHAISASKGKDCKMARSIRGEDMCQTVGTVTVESADNRKPDLGIPPVVPQPKRIVVVQNSVERMEEVFAQRKASLAEVDPKRR
jgi:formate dehydrogenase assembly factor FdhD